MFGKVFEVMRWMFKRVFKEKWEQLFLNVFSLRETLLRD